MIADTLSRLSSRDRDEIPGMQVKIHQLVEFSPVELQQIKDETAKDGTLQFLTQQVVQGWPDSIKKVHPEIKPFWNNRDDIFIQEGVTIRKSDNYSRVTPAANNPRNPQWLSRDGEVQITCKILCLLAWHI